MQCEGREQFGQLFIFCGSSLCALISLCNVHKLGAGQYRPLVLMEVGPVVSQDLALLLGTMGNGVDYNGPLDTPHHGGRDDPAEVHLLDPKELGDEGLTRDGQGVEFLHYR